MGQKEPDKETISVDISLRVSVMSRSREAPTKSSKAERKIMEYRKEIYDDDKG